jgi:hypothetical protein
MGISKQETRYLVFDIGGEYDESELRWLCEVESLEKAEELYRLQGRYPDDLLVFIVADQQPVQQRRLRGSGWTEAEGVYLNDALVEAIRQIGGIR